MDIIDFIFPRRCLGCDRLGKYFCPDCLKTVEPLENQICPVCHKAAISGKTHFQCQTKFALDGLVSIFPYRGLVKKAILKLKYRFVTDLAEELVEIVFALSQSEIFSLPLAISQSAALVPVPLHPRRQRWRGFNQAEVFGKLLAERINRQFQPDLLKRARYTQPQVELKKEDRAKNIHNAFCLSLNASASQAGGLISRYPNILIFDDVWTTGSTLKECAKVLKKAGAKRAWGLTLAR